MTCIVGRSVAARIFLTAALLAAPALAVAQAQAFRVGSFKPWNGYAIPNGEWLSLDFNGDGRDDVVHVVQGRGYVHTWLSRGDGTFSVGTFRPWAGYATPNGLWLAADINGDGRDDIVHAVRGRDYVHTWTSNGDGTFRVGTFRPWSGYSIPNGEWRVLDLDDDGRDDIVHVVAGRDYVHTWRSNGNGTFRVGTFRPWTGYAMPNGVWLTGDIDGDGDGDLVHAVQGRDYVHTWRSDGDGTFTLGTFRPWSGYVIPNGEWRVLDFNGDGLDDIVHIVARTDFIHTWRSLGDGRFAVGTFRPWTGYAMPNGLWLTGDFDNDNRDDLVHAVAGRDYVHTWLSRGNGAFSVGTFRPWPGYAIPNGLWLTGDINRDGKTDIVHAVSGRDYAHSWISLMPGPNELFIDGIEMTQAIQNMDHSVPMVAGKATVARVYPALRGGAPKQIRGRLWIWNTAAGNWVRVDSANTVTVDPTENGAIRVKRETTDKGLNFVVPASHSGVGWSYAIVSDFRDAASGASLACSGCGVVQRQVRVGDRNTFRVRTLGMRYTAGSPAATFAPRQVDYTLLASWLRRAYPTGDLRFNSATVNSNLAAPFGCADVNARLTGIRNADVAAGTSALTHYYGMTFDDADSRSFFMRGCAAGIPGNPSPGTVSSGPTGAQWGWDTDGSYGDWYGGHEIGHTLGRFHLGSGCGDSSDDSNYPYPNGQISGVDGAFVGFDTGDNANGIAMAALPGTVWSDVMSYCANQWISDYTYELIRQRIAAENALGAAPSGALIAAEDDLDVVTGAATPAEIVEGDTSAPHAGPAGAAEIAGVAPAGAPSLPGERDGGAVLAESPEAAYAAPPEAFTAADAPPSPMAGNAAAEELAAEAGPPPEPDAGQVGAPQPGSPATRAAPPSELPLPPETELVEGDFLAVAGTANLTRNEGRFVDVRRVDRGLVPSGSLQSPVTLDALNSDGEVIESWAAPFLPNSEREEGEDLIGVVDAMVPFVEGTVSLRLSVEGVAADTFESAPSGLSPRGAEGGLRADALQAVVRDGIEVLDWSAVGEAPAGVTYDVQVSSDEGESWETIGLGLADTSQLLDLSRFDAPSIQVRVLSNSGFETEVLGEGSVLLRSE